MKFFSSIILAVILSITAVTPSTASNHPRRDACEHLDEGRGADREAFVECKHTT